MTPRLTLDYGLRWELYTPIVERAHRTAGFLTVNGAQEYVVNPQPGYRTDWNGWGPRVQAVMAGDRQAGGTCRRRHHRDSAQYMAGQHADRRYALCGDPRLLSATNAPIAYGFQITPSQLPPDYTPGGVNIFASGQNQRRCAQHGAGREPLRAGHGRADAGPRGQRFEPGRH